MDSACLGYVHFVVDRFLFTDNARMTTLVGEKFVVGMIGTLCDALESEYGILIPRLYRIFRPLKGLCSLQLWHSSSISTVEWQNILSVIDEVSRKLRTFFYSGHFRTFFSSAF